MLAYSSGTYLVRFAEVDDDVVRYEYFHGGERDKGHRSLHMIAEDWLWALRTEEDWLCAILEDRYDP